VPDAETTLTPASDRRLQRLDDGVPALTVLWHPDPERVGDRFVLNPFLSGKSVALSRGEPRFAPPRGGAARTLGHRRVSRRPLALRPAPDGGVDLDPSGSSTVVDVDGRPLTGVAHRERSALERGVVVLLGNRIVLLLHLAELDVPPPSGDGMVGAGAGISGVRREIRRVAAGSDPVLLRGETGTGKELVARAIHRASVRCERPYVAVNVGAIPGELAASELFGSDRGAFTGAGRREGYLRRAAGGTLFLDEIGAAPDAVQVALLRVLDRGEIQPVGAREARRVDVRVVAATDADLAASSFRRPLFYRLAGDTIEIPPLRARRDDLGRLLLHFLREELPDAGAGRLDPPADPDARSWMPAALVARLASWDWPGNVRELRGVVRQLVSANLERSEIAVPPALGYLLESDSTAGADPVSPAPPRTSADVGADELYATLRAERWSVRAAARRLGIPPTTAYRRIAEDPRIRKASELGRAEIEAARKRCGDNRRQMAEELEVSVRGLLRRLKELGLA